MSTEPIVECRRQVRTNLAHLRAIVQRSAPSATSLSDYVEHLIGRIDTLARIQEILMRDPGAQVDLAELVADEFLTQGVAPGSVQTSHASLMVDRSVAAALALALHELATNAIKFGQLHVPTRHIAVDWGVCDDPPGWGMLDWREQPLPPEGAPQPVSQGFGFELVRSTLPYEIGARTHLELGPAGLHCQIIFRLAGLQQ